MSDRDFFGMELNNNYDQVAISIAATDTIHEWSKGEVKNPETINYRTFKPEPGGLFCQRIFGPVRDYEAGKYKGIKYKGMVCERTGIECTVSRVRRDRMGHIDLAVPVTHIWFLKSMPSRLGLLLDMTAKNLERVIYYQNYIVVNPGKTPLEEKQLLTEQEYLTAIEEYGEDAFKAQMGAEALRDILTTLDLENLTDDLREQMQATRSKQIKKKISKRLKVISGFINSGSRPEWMVMEAVPVLPPDLRPLVPLEGGRFATSDLNDLYRRVINRNNRLKNLLQLKTPDVIIHNEKRMLQEAVDALFDNGRHGRAVTGAGNRPLKSLSDMLKGKQGRFRQNLLGKRVDYSGRSVIVIGPEMKLNQCGLPKKMALTLFEPFIIRRLKELGFVHTVRGARKMIESRSPEVWDILEEVTNGHPVLLNRAPSLHRLSIQAFEPKLIEGDAIRVHPLVCAAYNADFDGDQMAVHVPLSVEAIMECKMLMMATHNIFSPSSGKPILTPSQDIVLGAYYLTMNPRNQPREGASLPIIANLQEAIMAETQGTLNKHSWVRIKNPDFGKKTIFGNAKNKLLTTTLGRIQFNNIWPDEIGFINESVAKAKLGDLILNTYKVKGEEHTVKTLDNLKETGFEVATKAGLSIGMEDMIIPKSKEAFVEEARRSIDTVEEQYRKGILTGGERRNKIIEIWTTTTDQIASAVFDKLENNNGKDHVNPVYLMMDSGARGNRQQVRQLCGIRGLMAKPSGEIIERPIIASFREGLSILEYFISTHGARKGLADTALKTAEAGYLTRKLCDVAMDVVVTEKDDGNRNGIWMQGIYEGDDEIVSLSDRISGRAVAADVQDPNNPQYTVVVAGQIITEEKAKEIIDLGIERVKVLSPLTSRQKSGVTALEYGIDPATNKLVEKGSAVGIMAAQSIGEPGTQLTMRTFHIGGVATGSIQNPEIRIRKGGIVKYQGLRTVTIAGGQNIVLNKTGSVVLEDEQGSEIENYKIVVGSVLSTPDGEYLEKGEVLAMWDPHNVPILSEKAGVIAYSDMIPGVTIKSEIDESSDRISSVVVEHKEDLNPTIEIHALPEEFSNKETLTNKETQSILKRAKVIATCAIPVGAQIQATEGDIVLPGALLAKTPRQASKTQDITGGLPRVAELFEARRPKESTEMAKIDGVVSIEGTLRNKKRLMVTDLDSGESEEHLIQHGKQIIVQLGDLVQKGQHLTEGSADPHEILEIHGPSAVHEFLLSEVQKVYRMQGVSINDKHIEVIISQMLKKIRITEVGDSDYYWGEQVDRYAFLSENDRIAQAGGQPAEGEVILLGITKAALETESFISAASFQETTRVLTESSTLGKVDHLHGFKENVILGNLIPAGTGLPEYRKLTIDTIGDAQKDIATEPSTTEELGTGTVN